MTDRAEFGPIDIQLRKTDEVGERSSGLTPMQALQYLENQSVSLFKRHFKELRFDEELQFSTKMGAEIATNLTIGLLGRLYEQLDPIRLAEVDRSLRISTEYATRLATGNLKPKALERLLADYPSHSFVIDRAEAQEIFNKVTEPPAKLYEIGEFFRNMGANYLEQKEPFVSFVNELAREALDKENADAAKDAAGKSVQDSGGGQSSSHAGDATGSEGQARDGQISPAPGKGP